jgi:hypothetical protein
MIHIKKTHLNPAAVEVLPGWSREILRNWALHYAFAMLERSERGMNTMRWS